MADALQVLNALSTPEAERRFLQCCGARAWAREMAARRPFAGADALYAEGDRVANRLGPADWREAFAAHPRIGEEAATGAGRAVAWSAQEQAAAGAAPVDPAALAAAHRAYEARFGYIFIICATGRTAAEMLAALERRLRHTPEQELQVAAAEQRRITRLRLGKLLRELTS
jgi:OHCU decarboxylase